jgi:hypothetical protein
MMSQRWGRRYLNVSVCLRIGGVYSLYHDGTYTSESQGKSSSWSEHIGEGGESGSESES